MSPAHLWLRLLAISVAFASSPARDCGPEFRGKCSCGLADYEAQHQYVVNCTNEGFADTEILKWLPAETEVLIFVGNDVPEVPWNIFGTINDLDKLRVVDMSRNRIREIKGKSYHHVSNVERLILNHNELVISEDEDENHHHPRVFSNFVNLKELHLTNAFADDTDAALAEDLHDIFAESNLTKLYKLHLEQNEIVTLRDKRVFCDLPELHDLHLGDNALSALSFNLTCLRRLRFLDLHNNRIATLTKRELNSLSAAKTRSGADFTVDLGGNPFACDCGAADLVSWLRSTNVTVRNRNELRCVRSNGVAGTPLSRLKLNACPGGAATKARKAPRAQRTAVGLIVFAAIFALSMAIIFVYVNRFRFNKKLTPLIESITKKVQYTTIRNRDNVDDIGLVAEGHH